MSGETGSLLASGRSADIFETGGGRVVRRRRSGSTPDREVVAMTAARAHGYPVPEIFRVDGAEMEMERVDGRNLLDEVAHAPWRVRRVARTLAQLHLHLRDVPIDGLRIDAIGEPVESLVHGRARSPSCAAIVSRTPTCVPTSATASAVSSIGTGVGSRRSGDSIRSLCRRRPRSARRVCVAARRTTASAPTWVAAEPTYLTRPKI